MDLYVYGTGCGAGELIDSGLDLENLRAFVESAPQPGASFMGRSVISPDELAGRAYDLLIVTSRDVHAIAARCEAAGIDMSRVLYMKNHYALTDLNTSYEKAAALLPESVLKPVQSAPKIVREPPWEESRLLPANALENDYVRVKTLEALCLRLADVPGAAAELGVYKGAFARCINALLPERTLYLFDSFEGFDPQEAARERASHPLGEGFLQSHRNTAEEAVLRALPHPERAVLMPGLFPASLNGLEERFALVSLDVDLEESTLAGLRYFYPRLSNGGFLMLHDYNSPKLPGVRAALTRFEAELGRRLPAVPLCDVNGSLVIPALL